MIFEFGISLEQLKRLKVRHIKRNYKYLLFRYKGIQIYKALSFYSLTLLKYNVITNSLKDSDFVIFDKIETKNKKERLSIIKSNINNFLNFRSLINKYTKKIFLIEINSNKRKYKINRIDVPRKKIFFLKIWDFLNDYSNEEEQSKNKYNFDEISSIKNNQDYDNDLLKNEFNFDLLNGIDFESI